MERKINEQSQVNRWEGRETRESDEDGMERGKE